jgi:hypothetical protein
MFEDKNLAQVSEDIPGRAREVFVTSSVTVQAYAMTVITRILRVTVASTYTMTVTLPPVAEAKGKIYAVHCVNAASGEVDVTCPSSEGSVSGTTIALEHTGDSAILLSDGMKWWNLSNNT